MRCVTPNGFKAIANAQIENLEYRRETCYICRPPSICLYIAVNGFALKIIGVSMEIYRSMW